MYPYLKTINVFWRSFSVSAVVGLLYLIAVETAQYILQYHSTPVHTIVTFSIYLSGVALNYALQRKIAFRASNQPILAFFLYNFLSAVLVSALSGFFYSQQRFKEYFGGAIESVSIVLSLVIIFPVTFFVFRHLFHNKSS